MIMAADATKEIELEIGHVLFIDIVGYSKLSVNEQHAGGGGIKRRLFALPSNSKKPKRLADYSKSQRATGWRWSFTPVRKRLRNARWRSAGRLRNIPVCNFGWESTAVQSAGLSM